MKEIAVFASGGGYNFKSIQENIAFEPNPDNDFMPTYQQIASGQYPVGTAGAYHLGFFAAITIETSNVILDLNGFSISQSNQHNIMQRFFALIEFVRGFIFGGFPWNLIAYTWTDYLQFLQRPNS